jgi:hypothetical protein
VVQITGDNVCLTVMVSNQPGVTETTEHQIEINNTTYSWNGFLAVKQETK